MTLRWEVGAGNTITLYYCVIIVDYLLFLCHCRVNTKNYGSPGEDSEGEAAVYIFGELHLCETEPDENCYYFNRLNETWIRFDPPQNDKNL